MFFNPPESMYFADLMKKGNFFNTYWGHSQVKLAFQRSREEGEKETTFQQSVHLRSFLSENVRLGPDSRSKDYGIQTVTSNLLQREEGDKDTSNLLGLHRLLLPFALIPCIHDV